MSIYVNFNPADTDNTIRVPSEVLPELNHIYWELPYGEVVSYGTDYSSGRQTALVSYLHRKGFPIISSFFTDRLMISV